MKAIKSYLYPLALFLTFNLIVLLIRDLVIETNLYNFLLFNLFLGFLPILVAFILTLSYKKLSRFWIIVFVLVWLIFYPNAPYMITDLIHVNAESSYVIYDALIIFSFAMLSLFFGFYSIKMVQNVIQEIWNKKVARIAVAASIVLSSFGIYLGRILRLNSWDIFTEPIKTFLNILHHLSPIEGNIQTYIIIVLFSCIQYILLLTIKDNNEIVKS